MGRSVSIGGLRAARRLAARLVLAVACAGCASEGTRDAIAIRESFDTAPFFSEHPPAPSTAPQGRRASCHTSRNGAWTKVSWAWPVTGCRLAPENARVDAGILRLAARPGPPHEGAQIESTARHGFGRYRASLRTSVATGSLAFPPDTGVVDGFFHYAEGHGEIDVEILSRDQSARGHFVRFTVHRGDRACVATGGPVRLPFDPSARFHVYGFDWRRDRVDFFVDPPAEGAIPVASVTASEIEIPEESGHVILNTWSGSEFSGAPPRVATEMQVDWVEFVPARP